MSAARSLCWAAGVVRPSTEFRPHMGDRAFRYGDGVFATLALRHGRLLDALAHVARLNSSVGAMGLSTPDAVSSVDRLCEVLELVGVDGTTDGVVRVQVSAVAGRNVLDTFRQALDLAGDGALAASYAQRPTRW